MNQKTPISPTSLLLCYILIIIANWLYVYYLKNSFVTVNSAWFLMTSLIGYVYTAFAIISFIFIYRNDKLGYALACCVILLGMMADVLSYAEVNQYGKLQELLLAVLLAVNLIVLVWLGWRLTSGNKS